MDIDLGDRILASEDCIMHFPERGGTLHSHTRRIFRGGSRPFVNRKREIPDDQPHAADRLSADGFGQQATHSATVRALKIDIFNNLDRRADWAFCRYLAAVTVT